MVASTNSQKSISDLLAEKRPVRSAEIIPPRNGAETDNVLKQIEALKAVPVDFISVTKGAGGSLRGGTLPIAQMIKARFDILSLAHFTCRDFTVEEIENSLMDHHYFGVTNILALRGDPPDGQPDYFKDSPNRHIYAWQLAKQISAMNRGEYLFRESFDKPDATGTKSRKASPTAFCIGVAAHPEADPIAKSVEYLLQKQDAGASYAITQMLFDAAPYERFLELCANAGVRIPIIPGVRIVAQAATAERMSAKFGVSVPADLITQLKTARTPQDGTKIGLTYTHNLVRRLLKAGAPGIHVFVMNDERAAAQLLSSI